MTVSNRRHRTTTAVISVSDTHSLSSIYDKNQQFRAVDTDYEGRESLNKKICIYPGDISDLAVDAIVCPTQTDLHLPPYGLHRHVTSRAGIVYQETCQQVGFCKPGKAFITSGYSLNARNIIHTAGPPPDTTLGYQERLNCLQRSYRSCLKTVKKSKEIKTVAFPCLGTGGAGLVLADAVKVAIEAMRAWLETKNNSQKIDNIVLVTYDENQWQEYVNQLARVFPYGQDLAGIDLETLEIMDTSTLAKLIPDDAQVTYILCYQYKKPVCKLISKHFQKLVNTVYEHLGQNEEPVERYKNGATFLLTSAGGDLLVVLYHGIECSTVEAEVVCYHDNQHSMTNDVCENLRIAMKMYLLANMENVTKFDVSVRCNKSSWGDVDGMTPMRKLEKSSHSSIQCRHRKPGNKFTHLIHPGEMLKHWKNQTVDSIGSGVRPVQHEEVIEDADTFTSAESSFRASLARHTPKLLNINCQVPKLSSYERVTGSQRRIPMEHEDDCDVGASVMSTHCSHKVQVFTKANTDMCEVNELTARHHQASFVPSSDFLQASALTVRDRIPRSPADLTANREALQPLNCQSNSGHPGRTLSNNIRHKPVQENLHQQSLIPAESSWNSLHSVNSRGHNSGGRAVTLRSLETSSSNSTCDMDLNDKLLLDIARLVGNKETQLGLELGLTYACIQRIKVENVSDAIMQAFCILHHWKIQQQGQATLYRLKDAMLACGIDTVSLRKYEE